MELLGGEVGLEGHTDPPKKNFTVQINNKQVDTLEQRCKHLKWSLFKNVLLTLKWGILNGGISLSRSVELKM